MSRSHAPRGNVLRDAPASSPGLEPGDSTQERRRGRSYAERRNEAGARILFTVSAGLAALSTALIAGLAVSLPPALVLRFLTGLFLAGVYPVGMKVMATWTKADRGLGIGLLVGALTLGSASPHLVNALIGVSDWRLLLFVAAGLAAAGGLIAALFVREGPYRAPSPPFNWRYALENLRVRELRLVNLGYLGHMWELYAMWGWIAAFFLASFNGVGIAATWASLAAFMVIAAGGLGSLLAGKWADQYGRTTIAIASLLISGSCAVLAGFLMDAHPLVLLAVCLVWGFAIVADSAQYSAALSELCRQETMGSALTFQTSLGFLLTMFTIRLVPMIADRVGWQWAFTFLAIGPVIGVWAMLSLRSLPAAVRLAGGKR
jgi:MFS family permease